MASLGSVEDDRGKSLSDALATELRLAHAASGRLSAPKLEELTGIGSDTIRRTLKGDRTPTVVELIKYGEVMDFDEGDLISRTKERAQAESGRPSQQQSDRLREKLALLASSVGKTTDTIYPDVVHHMSRQGFHFPRAAWQEILSGSGAAVRREVLFAIASALDVDPRYLASDDPVVDREVEGRLRFQRAMIDLGVEEVAARSLKGSSFEDLDAIQRTVARAIEEAQNR